MLLLYSFFFFFDWVNYFLIILFPKLFDFLLILWTFLLFLLLFFVLNLILLMIFLGRWCHKQYWMILREFILFAWYIWLSSLVRYRNVKMIIYNDSLCSDARIFCFIHFVFLKVLYVILLARSINLFSCRLASVEERNLI